MIRVKIRKIFFASLLIALSVFAIHPYDTGILAAESGVNPVATAAIGGLMTVIVVSLFLLPVMYAAVAEHTHGRASLRQ